MAPQHLMGMPQQGPGESFNKNFCTGQEEGESFSPFFYIFLKKNRDELLSLPPNGPHLSFNFQIEVVWFLVDIFVTNFFFI